MKAHLTLSATVLAAALTLTGCSTGSEPSGPAGSHHGSGTPSGAASATSSGDHNDADTSFARMMIPHHAQAVEMSDIVLAKDGVPDPVRDLAARIKAAQGPEIELMTGWLEAWGESKEMTGHAHHGMDGMMSAAELDKLKAAPGAEAAQLFLTQMIAHHEGAIAMARTEAADGRNPDAVQLSRTIISEQEAEIREMKELLGGQPASASGLSNTHIHGLHVDAETGTVLLATHEGLFDVTAPPGSKIGNTNDLMGFSGAGQGVFYASGHPGPGSDLPNPMGLIRSVDGGRTWERLSRQGESDFHSLTVSKSGIVGFDGTLLTSSDGKTWSKASADFSPAVLAGSPSSDVVVGTTPDGLYRSTDGGKNWELNRTAPIIQFAAFAGGTVVYGIEPNGTVHSSTDAGSTWSRTGAVEGKVQAITAVETPAGGPQLWVATAAGVVMSSDGGATFTGHPAS